MGNNSSVQAQPTHQPNHQNPVTQTPTRNQVIHNGTQIQINSQVPTKPFNAKLGCFNKLSTKVKLIVILISLLFFTGIFVAIQSLIIDPITIILPVGTDRGEIAYNGQYLTQTMRTVQLNIDGRTKEAAVYGVGLDGVQVSHFNTQSILKGFKVGSVTFYEFLIPVFSIFEKFGLEKKQKTLLPNWLEVINENVRETVDTMQDMIAEVFSRGSSTKKEVEIPSKFNLIYINQTQTVWAIVEYDPFEQKFRVVQLNQTYGSSDEQDNKGEGNSEKSNLKAENKERISKQQKTSETEPAKQENYNQQVSVPQTEQPKQPLQTSQTSTSLPEQQKSNSFSEQQTSTLLNEVILQTVGYIKRKAEQSIQVYKERSKQVKKIHKQLTDNEQLSEEWQKALIECGFVSHLLFRCPFKAVEKLVPGMTQEQLMAPDGNYLLTYGLKIFLKESEHKQQ